MQPTPDVRYQALEPFEGNHPTVDLSLVVVGQGDKDLGSHDHIDVGHEGVVGLEFVAAPSRRCRDTTTEYVGQEADQGSKVGRISTPFPPFELCAEDLDPALSETPNIGNLAFDVVEFLSPGIQGVEVGVAAIAQVSRSKNPLYVGMEHCLSSFDTRIFGHLAPPLERV